MLYDSLSIPEVVDAECAHEFLKEATKLASSEELADMGDRLGKKSELFGKLLAEDAMDRFDKDDLKALLNLIFSLRRKSGRLLRENGLDKMRSEIRELLYGEEPVKRRFDRFTTSIKVFNDSLAPALASELLHYSRPERYWLWTPWIWDPKTKAGALSLVIQNDVDLSGSSNGEIYENVGKATALVDALGHQEGYSSMGKGLSGTNVFLGCVYAVYMFAVFKMRLSQEFNRILPELPELARRILGVQRMESN